MSVALHSTRYRCQPRLGLALTGLCILMAGAGGLSPARAAISSDSLVVPGVERAGLGSVLHGAPDTYPLDDHSAFWGSLSFETSGYLYSPRTKSEDVYPTLIGRPRVDAQNDVIEIGGQGEGIVLSSLSRKDQPNAYFELPEVYIGTSDRLNPNLKISIGRKLQKWNHLDEEWKLGIWQPRFRWDYLRPDVVGMTGVTVEMRKPWFKAVLFGSPVFIPERGVPISNENGELISDSPWFISPPSHISVLSRDTRLQYDLRVPPTRNVIDQWNVSGMFRLGQRLGPWFSAGYAYKPMNQLLLAYNGWVVINAKSQAQDVAEVPVVPRVMYHHLVSLEGGVNEPAYSAWVSALMDHPGKEATPALDSTYIEQTVTNSFAISPTFAFHVTDSRERRLSAHLSYLYQVGGNGPDLSPSGLSLGSGLSVFEARYPFQNAVKVGGGVEAPGLLKGIGMRGILGISSDFLYDIGNRGQILSSDVSYSPSPRWKVALGADILGSWESLDNSSGSLNDFIGRYRANDRVRGGVTYVF